MVRQYSSKNSQLNVVKKNCLKSYLNLKKEKIFMLCGIEFQVLTPWYEKR